MALLLLLLQQQISLGWILDRGGPHRWTSCWLRQDKVSLQFSKQYKSRLEPAGEIDLWNPTWFSCLPQEPECNLACAGQLGYVATHDFIKKGNLNRDLIAWPQCRDFQANLIGRVLCNGYVLPIIRHSHVTFTRTPKNALVWILAASLRLMTSSCSK